MMRNIIIEHKEVAIVCEESGPINLSYNVLLTTSEANIVVKPIVPTVIVKSTLTYIDYGKIDHLVEIYHHRKREVLVVLTTIVKSTEPIVGTKTQLVKLRKIPLGYPYIIGSNIEHRYGKCPRKIEV
jgi:hypothetical protein